LNARPKLRQVLKKEIGEYTNIQIEWIRGETPKAFFRDNEGKTVKEVELQDVEHAGFLEILKANGFVPTIKEVTFGKPIANGVHNGHYYEYYDTPAPFELANKFAISLANNTASAYLVTVTSKEEEEFVLSLIPEDTRNQHGGIWLGAQDVNEEGNWEWIGGPEKGVVLWQGPRAGWLGWLWSWLHAGQKVEGQYANWIKNEPNNANGEPFQEDCAILEVKPTDDKGRWVDVTCFPVTENLHALVVEYDSLSNQPFANNQNGISRQSMQEKVQKQEQDQTQQQTKEGQQEQTQQRTNEEQQTQQRTNEKREQTGSENEPLPAPIVKEFPLLHPPPQSRPSLVDNTSSSLTAPSRLSPKSLFYITVTLLFVFSFIFLLYAFYLTPKQRRDLRVWSSNLFQKFQNSSNRRRVDFQV